MYHFVVYSSLHSYYLSHPVGRALRSKIKLLDATFNLSYTGIPLYCIVSSLKWSTNVSHVRDTLHFSCRDQRYRDLIRSLSVIPIRETVTLARGGAAGKLQSLTRPSGSPPGQTERRRCPGPSRSPGNLRRSSL